MQPSDSCQKNKQLFQEEGVGGSRSRQGLCSLLVLGSGLFIRPVDSELHAKGRDVPLSVPVPRKGPASLTKRNYRSKVGLALEEGKPPPSGQTAASPTTGENKNHSEPEHPK